MQSHFVWWMSQNQLLFRWMDGYCFSLIWMSIKWNGDFIVIAWPFCLFIQSCHVEADCTDCIVIVNSNWTHVVGWSAWTLGFIFGGIIMHATIIIYSNDLLFRARRPKWQSVRRLTTTTSTMIILIFSFCYFFFITPQFLSIARLRSFCFFFVRSIFNSFRCSPLDFDCVSSSHCWLPIDWSGMEFDKWIQFTRNDWSEQQQKYSVQNNKRWQQTIWMIGDTHKFSRMSANVISFSHT